MGLPTGPPPVPENLVISHMGNHIYLSWDSVTGASYYTIYHASEAEPVTWDSLGTVTAPTTSFQHQNALNKSHRFYYVVSGN
jgi:hypothetical protein